MGKGDFHRYKKYFIIIEDDGTINKNITINNNILIERF